MTLPVLPPTLPSALPTLFAAPLNAGPADDVTFESPSDAFDWNFEAVSLALELAFEAASLAFCVVDEYLTEVCRATKKFGRRKRVREAVVADIVMRVACYSGN